MKKKSLAVNAVLNVVRNVSGILFPLITFPYVSRVLGVEGLGKYNFAYSIITYFNMLAGLGISTYAIREGSGFREDKEKLSKFASEILLLNTITTIMSYLTLGISILCFQKLHEYVTLILILSVQIVFTTLGIEWFYSIYEEFSYITIRTIAFKAISLILIFILVRSEKDLPYYSAITAFAVTGSGILNMIHSRKYCKYSFQPISSLKKHIKPVMIMFASNVAVMIYVSSDTTILGILKDDYQVGLYSVSGKIYAVLKTVISSILIVAIPRLAALYSNKKIEEYNTTLQGVLDAITTIMIPCIVGVVMLSEEMVILVGGKEYTEASMSLKILALALLFSLYGWTYTQCVLMPSKNEKMVSIAAITSAVVNIALNFILIPFLGVNAAALTTVIAEGIMFVMCYIKGRNITTASILNRNSFQVFIASIPIIIVCLFCHKYCQNSLGCICISVVLSAVLYFGILLLWKNAQIIVIFDKARKIVVRK